MNSLSIVTVVKNDFSSLKATYQSIRKFDLEHEWIVIDGGTDLETFNWMQLFSSTHMRYIRQKDKNLYDAMNKGIRCASGSHMLFLNAGDELVMSSEFSTAFSNLPANVGLMGCIRRSLGALSDSYYAVKPGLFLRWSVENGIKPANHQATIYPSVFLKSHPYDIDLGLFADQISILELLKTHPVQVSRKIILSTFKNGGLGDKQVRGAFLRQMQKFNFENGSNLKRFLLVLKLPLILIAKVFVGVQHRIVLLVSR
jgi:glycosyltransferase involved in cell wall biosynthesis